MTTLQFVKYKMNSIVDTDPMVFIIKLSKNFTLTLLVPNCMYCIVHTVTFQMSNCVNKVISESHWAVSIR